MAIRKAAICAAAMLLGAAVDKIETQVEAPGPLAPLRGTMISPSAKAPLVLIIPGSGPTDRDGNNPLGVSASSYRLLAEALAEQGIASVRIDKRGMFASKAAVASGNAVTVDDYAADVRSWVRSIRKSRRAKCVWVAGHSEGGLVALAASRSEPDICGLVLISAPGRRLGDVMRAQLRANPANAPLLEHALLAIGKLEAGETVNVSAFHPALQALFAADVQKFLISLFSYDPAELVRDTRKPVMIVQGDKDIQVSVEDAKRLAAARPDATLLLLPGVNHVLKAVPGDGTGPNIATYADPKLPLAPGIAPAIAKFIRANKAAREER